MDTAMKSLTLLSCSLGLLLGANIASAEPASAGVQLDNILAAQSDDAKARYQYRHPKETIEFFGIKPGMTVVEVFPGGGWYTKILAPYLGREGKIIAANYPDDLWSNFDWAKPDFIAKRVASTQKFPAQVKEWSPENTPKAEGYTFATLPETLSNSVDAVLYVRALHNLNRFNAEKHFLDNALSETHRILKHGGIVGIVQHSANSDDLSGARGYLKESALVAKMQKAGFTLVAKSDINANPKDRPKADDIVWRLSPSFYTSGSDEKMKAKYAEIGESNRMTLLFKKI